MEIAKERLQMACNASFTSMDAVSAHILFFFGTPLDYGPKIGRVFFLVMHAKNNFHNVDISYIIMNNDFTL